MTSPRKIATSAVALAACGIVGISATACSSSSSSSGSSKPSPVASLASLNHGQTTSVLLDSNFVAALTSLKVTPGVVDGATLTNGSVNFPITGGHVTIYKKGEVNPYVVGEIDHSGGLTLTAGGKTVTLSNFVIDPGTDANLKGDVAVNGASAVKGARLFDLHGSTLKPITIDSSTGVATLTGTHVNLSSDAAALLNKTFGITALKGGLLIGVATLKVGTK